MDRRFGPDEVRALRGTLTRAEFAERVGVTPLTVYRWELPVRAPEARRPRGRVAARLAELAGSARPDVTDSTSPTFAAAEQTALLPLLERVSRDLRNVEGDLQTLMASGRLSTLAGRAMAAQALARIALLARADVCGAFATVMPLLPELPRLPESVQLELQVTAALLFSWPDGRFLDPGRANAYLAGAERLLSLATPEVRALVLIARFTLGLLLEDAQKMASSLARAAELAPALASPAHEMLVCEAQAQAAAQEGRSTAAARAFQQVLDAPALPLSRVRALGYLAEASIHDGRAPEDALALVDRARALASKERLQPGQHALTFGDVAGAALCRLGRFEEASRALEEAIALAHEVGWSPAWPATTLAHVLLYTGQADPLRALARKVGSAGGISPGSARATSATLAVLADLADAQENEACVARLEAETQHLERDIAWHNLRGRLLLVAAMVAARSGTPEQAARVLRRAERHFEGAPSIWAGALLRRSRGIVLARQGQLHDARALVESALGTLNLSGDLPNATQARLLLARIGVALGERGAREQVALHRDALVRLGYTSGLDDLEALPRRPARATANADLERLVVPIQRIAARGMTPALVRRELVVVAAEIAGPETTIALEELDSAGRGTLVHRAGPELGAATEWVELGDGAGRRLRLGAGGPHVGSATHDKLTAIATVAELALELAALRGVTGNTPARPAPDDELPEVPGFISVSPPMRQLKADLVRLSRSRATVIITGESGSGKEVVARAIHDLSTRAGKPYIAFNCAAVPRDLFEGQLFGYRKGAFTGAASDHPGVLRAADGGTVLLDEIGELPLDIQPKLLRFLENGEILPLGERRPVKLDVRVIAATFRDLEQLVRERAFREDLYYRLQVVPLRVPPLRERPDDVVALARHFVRALAPAGAEPPVLAPDALAALSVHRWPGNVRELRNVIERSMAFEPLPPVLSAEHLRIA